MNAVSDPRTEVVRQFYSALNRNELMSIRELFDPQIERVEPPGFPTSGTYRGRTDVFALFTVARATWEEGACEPEEFFVQGDKIVVLVHVRVRLKNAVDWIDARIGDGFVFRGDRIVQMRTFANHSEALTWAKI